MATQYITYIVKCADSSLYTGVTTDIDRRLKQHNGLIRGGARYTKTRSPVICVYCEQHATRSQAQKRESAIKRLNKEQKQQLISSYPIISS